MLSFVLRKVFKKKIRIVYTIILLLLIKAATGYYSDTVDVYVEQKARQYTSISIEKSLREDVVSKFNTDELVSITNKSYGEFAYVSVDASKINELLSLVLNVMNEQMLTYEDNNDYNVVKLPASYVLLGGMFNDIGPELSFKITPVGSVHADVISDVYSYGINNSMIRLDLEITTSYQILIPLKQKVITVTNKIPLVIKSINGEVPKYYYNTGDSSILPQNPSGETDIDL